MSNEQNSNEYENMQLGEIAVKLGYITREQLNSMLKELKVSTETGSTYLIGEILIQKKLLNKKQLKHILSLQNRIMLYCEPCRKRFSIKNYDPNREYKCPHCMGKLILPPTKRSGSKKISGRNKKVENPKSDDLLISSKLSEIARDAFSMTDEPFERYSEFLRSFSDDKDEEAREVQEIIDTNSEEIVVLADDDDYDDFEAEFSINDPEDYSSTLKNSTSSIAQVDDSFVVSEDPHYYQSGISVLKILEEEQGVHASVDLSTDPHTERHLKKLKRIDSVSKYIVYDEVGRGGMGVVKLAFDQDVRRQIATKIIHPTSKEVPSKQERFLEEAQITGQLEHPNIVPVHDLGIDKDGNIFFTMKLVKGKSLLDVIELVADKKDGYDKYFTVTRFLQIFMKICDAVAFAHSKGVLHRDLKPENVMVGDYGEVMVMDWGLAKVRGLPDKRIDQVSTDRSEGKIHQTMDGSIVGTPGYMAPEQARGELEDVTERSDIYSLGAILYEILTYKQAFPGSDSSKVIQKVKRHKFLPPSISAPDRNIPRELEHVVLNAMAFNPDERYLTVNQLKEEIEAYIDGRVLSSVDYSMFQLVTKWIAKNLTSLTIAVILVLSFLVMAIFWANDITDERDEAITDLTEVQADNSSLKSEMAKIKKESENNKQLAMSDSIKMNVVSAIKNNDYVKLRALRQSAPEQYKKLIDYWNRRSENKVITNTQQVLYSKVIVQTSDEEDIIAVSSGDNLNIYENMNNVPTGISKLKSTPLSMDLSEDGTTVAACYSGGEYEVYDSLGAKLAENKIEDVNFKSIQISPLCNYLAIVLDSNKIIVLNWREEVQLTIDVEDSAISSNVQFISDTQLCFGTLNSQIILATWDKELSNVTTKPLQSDFVVKRLIIKGTNTILIDEFDRLWRTQTGNLTKIDSMQGILGSHNAINLRNTVFAIDFDRNYLWEASDNTVHCRDLSNGVLLTSFRTAEKETNTWQSILKINFELFLVNQQGKLFKLDSQYYKSVPVYVESNFSQSKIWKYRDSLYMVTQNGVFELRNNFQKIVEKTNSYDNKILHYSVLGNTEIYMLHADGAFNVYNLYTGELSTIENITLVNTQFIKVVKSTENAADKILIAFDNNKKLTVYKIDITHAASELWNLRVKYSDKNKISIMPELNMIYVLEYNNQINSYNLATGELDKEIMLTHKISEFFIINDAKTLVTRDSSNIVRIINLGTLGTQFQYTSPHFSELSKCFTDNELNWLITVSDDEIAMRKFSTNELVLTLKNFVNSDSTFIDTEKQLLYYIDRESHTLQSLDLQILEDIFKN